MFAILILVVAFVRLKLKARRVRSANLARGITIHTKAANNATVTEG